MVVLYATFRYNFDARTNAVTVALRSMQRNLKPVASLLGAVHPNLGVPANRAEHDIDLSVSIQISEGATTMPGGWRCSEPRLVRRRLPFSAASRVTEYCVVLVNWLAREGHGLHVAAAYE